MESTMESTDGKYESKVVEMESMTMSLGNLLRSTSHQQLSASSFLLPSLNPPGIEFLSNDFVHFLWRGTMLYKSPEVKPLMCTISSRVASNEKLRADKWPQNFLSPRLHFFHHPGSHEFAKLIQADTHSVMIQFSKEAEASLCNIPRPGLMGAALFSSTHAEASCTMYIVWLPDSGIFLGSFLQHGIQYINEKMSLFRSVVDSFNNQMNAFSQQQRQVLQLSILQHQFRLKRHLTFLKQVVDKVREYKCSQFTNRKDFMTHLYQYKATRQQRRQMRQQLSFPYSKYQTRKQKISSIYETYFTRGMITRSPTVPPSQELSWPTNESSATARVREILYEGLDEPTSLGASTDNGRTMEELMSKLKKCSVMNPLGE